MSWAGVSFEGHFIGFISSHFFPWWRPQYINTLSMIYKQQRFWATSLKLKWLLILIANFGFDPKNITSLVAYFPFQNINVAYFWLVIVA